MALHLEYRPKTLDEVFGNESTKESLRSLLKRTDRPHTYLLYGASGTGKTTIGRIIASMLGCSDQDFYEYNMSNLRGIDHVRELSQNCHYAPVESKVKVYLLDECFAKGSKINTPSGIKNIENVKIGDVVFNLEGEATVNYVFKNKVNLNRVVKVFTNKDNLICSSDHLFLTDTGWVCAKDLTKQSLLFEFSCDTVHNNEYLRKEKMQYGTTKNMPRMQPAFYPKVQKQQRVLQQIMCVKKEKPRKRIWYCGSEVLHILWRLIQRAKEQYAEIMFPKLCWEIPSTTAPHTRDEKIKNLSGELTTRSIEYGSYFKRALERNELGAYEKEQPFMDSGSGGKAKSNEKDKWNIRVQGERGKWNRPNFFGIDFINCIRKQMGKQLCCENVETENKRLSTPLQNRRCSSETNDSNRSGWWEPQTERTKRTRSKEGKVINGVRVESVEIYKRGSNDRAFEGIIGDKEIDQGFVEFYDLEINGHPSYYANGVLVHNCHRQTQDAQHAILKVLEDTPSHVYFILCTTEPDRLLKTIHTRCSSYQTQSLDDRKMRQLIQHVLKQEKVEDFSKVVIDEIIRVSDGSARQALVVLDQVIDLDDTAALAAVSVFSINEAESIDVCRAIANGADWNKMKTLVKATLLNTEPEKLRYAILGYLSAILLNKADNRISVLIDIFSDNTFSSGKAGIINMCYLASQK